MLNTPAGQGAFWFTAESLTNDQRFRLMRWLPADSAAMQIING